MVRTKQHYSNDLVKLSRSYILELWRALRRYENAMVLVGGWAPYYILQNFGDDSYNNDHIGSIDIDIALDPSLISELEYRSIESAIEDIGYSKRMNRNGDVIPFIFEKETKGSDFIVEVDILTSNYVSEGHRHGRVGGLLARKCHGADIAFKEFFEMRMEGELHTGWLAVAAAWSHNSFSLSGELPLVGAARCPNNPASAVRSNEASGVRGSPLSVSPEA
jgi:hypothetical protein